MDFQHYDKDLIVQRDNPEERPCRVASHSDDSLGNIQSTKFEY